MRGRFADDAEVEPLADPLADRRDVPRVPDGDDEPVGDLPAEVVDRLLPDRLLPLDPHRVLRVEEVDRARPREVGDDPHAAVEVRREAERERAVVERLRELLAGDLRLGEEDDGPHPGHLGRVGGEGGGGVARRGADDVGPPEVAAPTRRRRSCRGP